jgi:hypothetical protein
MEYSPILQFLSSPTRLISLGWYHAAYCSEGSSIWPHLATCPDRPHDPLQESFRGGPCSGAAQLRPAGGTRQGDCGLGCAHFQGRAVRRRPATLEADRPADDALVEGHRRRARRRRQGCGARLSNSPPGRAFARPGRRKPLRANAHAKRHTSSNSSLPSLGGSFDASPRPSGLGVGHPAAKREALIKLRDV